MSQHEAKLNRLCFDLCERVILLLYAIRLIHKDNYNTMQIRNKNSLCISCMYVYVCVYLYSALSVLGMLQMTLMRTGHG